MKGGDTITYYISIGIACAVLILVSSVIFAKKRKIRDILIFISAIGFVLFAMIPTLHKRMSGNYIVALYSLILLAMSVIHTLISKRKSNKEDNSYDDYLQRSASQARYEASPSSATGDLHRDSQLLMSEFGSDLSQGGQNEFGNEAKIPAYEADMGFSLQNDLAAEAEENFSTKRFEIAGRETEEELKAKLQAISTQDSIDEEQLSSREKNIDDVYDEMIYGQREALQNLMEEAGANCEQETEIIPLQKNILDDLIKKAKEQGDADVFEVPSLSDENKKEENPEEDLSISPIVVMKREEAVSAEIIEEMETSFEEKDEVSPVSTEESGLSQELQEEKPFNEMGFTEKFRLYVESQKQQAPRKSSMLDELLLEEERGMEESGLQEQKPPEEKTGFPEKELSSADDGVSAKDIEAEDLQDSFARKFKNYVQQQKGSAVSAAEMPQGDFPVPVHGLGMSDRMNQEDVDRAIAAMLGAAQEDRPMDQKAEVSEVSIAEQPFETEVSVENRLIEELAETQSEERAAAEVDAVLEELQADIEADSSEQAVIKEEESIETSDIMKEEIRIVSEEETVSSAPSLFENLEEDAKYRSQRDGGIDALLNQSDLDEAASAIFSMNLDSEEEIEEESVAEIELEEPEEAELETEELEEAQEQSVAAETEESAIEEAEMKEPAAEPEELEEEVSVAEVEIEEPAAGLEEAELETEELEEAQEQSVAAETEEPAIEEAEMKEPAAEPEELEEVTVAEVEIEEPAAEFEEIEEEVAVAEVEIEEPAAEWEEFEEEAVFAEIEIEEPAAELEELEEEAVFAEVEIEEPAAQLEELEEEVTVAEVEIEEPAAELEELEEEAVFAEIEIEEPAAEFEEFEEVAVAEIEIEEPAAELEELEEEVSVAEIEIEEPAAELEELEEVAVAEVEIEEPAAEFEEFEEEVSVAEVEIEEPAAEFEEFEEEVSVAEVEIEEPAVEFEEFEEEVAVAEIEIEEEKAEASALDEDEIKHEILTQEEDAYVEIRNKRTISKVFSQAMYQKALENLEKGQVLEAVEKLSNLVVHSTDENIMISSYFKLKDLLGSSDEEMLEITRKLLLAHQDINGVYVDIIKKYMKDVI